MTTILRRKGLGATSCRGVADKMQASTNVMRSDRMTYNVHSPLIRWGCTASIPPGVSVINKASAISEVSDKATFRVKLSEAGLAVPAYTNADMWEMELSEVVYPQIVRPKHHAGGRELYKADNAVQLMAALGECGEDGYSSDYFPKVKEYRVVVAQGRVVFVVEKVVDDVSAIAWNRSQGSTFVNVKWGDWPLKVVKQAVAAHLLSSLDFSGVDVMVDEGGEVSVLELNSAPTLTSEYRQQKMADVFDWMIEEGSEVIPVVEGLGDWKKWGHPALSERVLT